jgi:hypothetical protein
MLFVQILTPSHHASKLIINQKNKYKIKYK